MADWSRRIHTGVNVLRIKQKGDIEYQLLETFDETGNDTTHHHYYMGIKAPHAVADPSDLGPDRPTAERLFEEQTK